MKQLSGRLQDICSGRTSLPLVKVHAYREKLASEGYDLPELSISPKQKRKSGCCGKNKKRKSLLARVASAGQALARFIGDGAQFTSDSERGYRETKCGECPLNDAGWCGSCGCNLAAKIRMRKEWCPTFQWQPDVRDRRTITEPVRNLMMHIYPVSGNGIWQWNVKQIAERNWLFNGKVVIAVATDGKTDSADDVVAEFRKQGVSIDHLVHVENNSKLREVETFIPMMELIKTTDSSEVTFACHAKGVTHTMDSITVEWANAQYHVCLDEWWTIQNALEQFSMAGSFRRFGQFRTRNNNRWHYSGTFYWFRHDDVFSRDWRIVDKMFFGTESWPGRMFEAGETACVFADNADDPYKEHNWANRYRRELELWNKARGIEWQS